MGSGCRWTCFVAMFSVAALAASGVPSQAVQQVPPEVWSAVDEVFVPPRRQPLDHYVRTRMVRIDLDVLRTQATPGDRINLSLLPGVAVQAELDKITDDEFNGYVWRGRVVGEPMSMVTLVLEPDGLAGTVLYSGGSFALRYVGDGLSAVLESDPNLRRPDEIKLPPALPASVAGRPGARVEGRTSTEVDVLGVYNPVAATQVGGKRAIKADFKTAIANWQTALDNSKIDIDLRLIAVKKLKYSPRGTSAEFFEQLLEDLTVTGDGLMEKIHKLRDKFGADDVVLAGEINDIVCGIGWLNGSGDGVAADEAPWGFNAVSVDCLAGFGGQTTAHEGGHNFGLNHDAQNARLARFSGAYTYSFGFRKPGKFRTVMAYPCGPDGLTACSRAPYFSNPKVRLVGSKTGKKNADNARSLQNDRGVFSEWRACKKKC